jgi:RNA polymerase sigma-70 factor (ECF subfamily)
MTETLVRFSQGVDLTVRRSWRALQNQRTARPPTDRAPRGVARGRAAHGLRAVGSSPSDEELLRAIAGGDGRAVRALVDRHNVRIFRFALSITKDRSLAEEVVNDVLFDVVRRAGSFEGRSRASTWMLAIARNKAISSLQRRGGGEDELADTIVDTTDDPEVALQKRQATKLVADCIGRLPAIHREIIDLVYYHQKSIQEIAEILRIPTNTVKSRMFYARRGLAAMLSARDGAGQAQAHASATT